MIVVAKGKQTRKNGSRRVGLRSRPQNTVYYVQERCFQWTISERSSVRRFGAFAASFIDANVAIWSSCIHADVLSVNRAVCATIMTCLAPREVSEGAFGTDPIAGVLSARAAADAHPRIKFLGSAGAARRFVLFHHRRMRRTSYIALFADGSP